MMSVFDNYECDGQMSIFDFLPEQDLNKIPEAEMVAQVGAALGIKFEYIDDFWGWVYKEKKITVSCGYSNYSFGDHERFIHFGVSSNRGGSSGPWDSIEEAIRFGRKAMKSMGLKPKE